MLRTLSLLLCMALAAPVFAAKVPRPLPANTVIEPALGRKPIRLADYKGKVIALILFSTECGHCERAVATMGRIQTQLGSQGVQVVGAAVNSGAISLIDGFIQKNQPPFPVGVLTEAATKRLADFQDGDRPFVPILLFVDRKGTIQQQYFGDHPFFKELDKTAPALLRNLLGQK